MILARVRSSLVFFSSLLISYPYDLSSSTMFINFERNLSHDPFLLTNTRQLKRLNRLGVVYMRLSSFHSFWEVFSSLFTMALVLASTDSPRVGMIVDFALVFFSSNVWRTSSVNFSGKVVKKENFSRLFGGKLLRVAVTGYGRLIFLFFGVWTWCFLRPFWWSAFSLDLLRVGGASVLL